MHRVAEALWPRPRRWIPGACVWVAVVIGWSATIRSQEETRRSSGDTEPLYALRSIHEQARQARERRDFATVERLRLERLAALKFVDEPSAWTNGLKAMERADSLLKAMRYRDAAIVIQDAWRPFSDSKRTNDAVFGDIAVKMFEIQQAALAVYAEATPMSPALSATDVKSAIDRAIKSDPCQVESLAIEAFLTRPNPDESFQPAELQESLRRRNASLLNISYVAGDSTRVQPWHGPVEFLKAKSSSFVLDDLKYIEDFLDPRTRLIGRDRDGERFAVVLAGALLVNDGDPDARLQKSRFFVDEFVAGRDGGPGKWVRMRPQLLAVSPVGGSNDGADVRLAVDNVVRGVRRLEAQLFPSLEEEISSRCREIAKRHGFPPADGIPAYVAAILEDRLPPGQSAPAGTAPPMKKTLEEKLRKLAEDYQKYAANLQERKKKAVDPEKAIAAARESEALLGEYLNRKAKGNRGDWKRSLAIFELSPDSSVDGATGSQSPAGGAQEPGGRHWANRDWLRDVNGFRAEVESERQKAAAELPLADEASNPAAEPEASNAADRVRSQVIRTRLGICADLLDLLDKLVFFEYCQRVVGAPPVLKGSAIETIAKVEQQAMPTAAPSGAGSDGPVVSSPAERNAARLLKAASESLRSAITAQPPDENTDTPPPLSIITAQRAQRIRAKIADIQDAFRALPGAAAASDQGDANTPSPKSFFDGFIEDCERLFTAMELELEVRRRRGELSAVRRLTPGRSEWTFSDFPPVIPIKTLASLIDEFPRVVVSAIDLDQAAEAIADGDAEAQRRALVPLRSECSTLSNNPLVMPTATGPILALWGAEIDRPSLEIALVIFEEDQPNAGPKWEVDDDGQEFLRIDQRGGDLRAMLRTPNGAHKGAQLVLEYPGVDGHLELVARASPYVADSSAWRYLEDRRRNRISISPMNADRLLRIVSTNGQEFTDRSVNYSVKDWIDLDRNIVNEFMPRSLTFAPSLPTWLVYRQELSRPKPPGRPSFKWSVPRPLFTVEAR
jgi:hypothetical protein